MITPKAMRAVVGALSVIIFALPFRVVGCASEDDMIAYMGQNRNKSNNELAQMAISSPAAQAYLGWRFIDSAKYPHDPKQSEVWYEKSAANGCIFARAELGRHYFQGNLSRQDYGKALAYLRGAYNFSSAANLLLGEIYARGLGVQPDPSKALELFSSAKSLEDPMGQFWMGIMLSGWEGVTPDYERGVEFYKQSASQGFVFAQYALGYAYHIGQGVSQDFRTAAEWYDKAAAQGHVWAKALAKAVRTTDDSIVIDDPVLKRELIEKVLRPSDFAPNKYIEFAPTKSGSGLR